MKLTDSQFNTLLSLSVRDDISGCMFNDKRTLKNLAVLAEFGLIDYDPSISNVPLTASGRAALAEAKGKK